MNERLVITYPTEPGEVLREVTTPFRCGYCGKMVEDGLGRWVVREPYVGPGQFVAVHLTDCRKSARKAWWWR